MHIYVQTEEKYDLATIRNEQIDTDSNENLKSTNVRTVQVVHSAIYARKQKKETPEKSSSMKSGSLNKNMYVPSFQTKKLVKFTGNAK